ncbi:MAG TPA: isoprenylcysteine carboxylmethyltransferase family protein [Terriglobia bacterium]|nr:isoprenylcysteine carboxylmethyltransferase family protein [Terriglobia bacterium]
MRATDFEFRYRFFIITALFIVGFESYALDPVNVSAMLARWLMGHRVEPGVSSEKQLVQMILGLGALLTILAALVRTWAAAYLRSEVVHDSNLHAEGLVADGPFRYVRNPLYLGAVLFAIGFGLAASRLGFIVIVGGLTLFYYRLIAREEWLLSETQGESYRQFLKAVPRLLPSLTPRVPPGGLAPRWGQAFVGETFMWFFALAAVCFAVTLSQRLFLTMIIAGIAASFLAKAVLGRRGHHDTA